jgi:hypothetical protein
MQQLKQMVTDPVPSALRYSLLPAPPLTELEFYAALVQDYKRTAQHLPTLLSRKIRAGVPPPLRGVVWQSMSGACDPLLEEEYERLCGESSPYEGIIGKDLGRSFPGVEMFRDPDGDGQRMLGKVLKCFSLYDHKIGYCQGLGFLVGPLLMHMGDKQAFCVLVRLMENYDLRNCYLPDLSGLHVRIFQFSSLLRTHLPKLSSHLEELQIEPAYVSQWFLSFFAVTCPLSMLFRIYDVIFLEGASETIMRVALAVMRKNEEKILACTEFEDVMQLLLSRGLWDCYHMDADEFVSDFVSFTTVISHDVLQGLDTAYRKSQEAGKNPVDATNVFKVGTRFLGRLWNSSNKATTLDPNGLAPNKHRGSFLRRSTSKQSMASTLNSVNSSEGSTDSIMSVVTDATSNTRNSSNSESSIIVVPSAVSQAQKSLADSNKSLHNQIEDLLMALSEMQRDQALAMTELQKEREEREEDRKAVRVLVEHLKQSPKPEGRERSVTITQTTLSRSNSDLASAKDEDVSPRSSSQSEIHAPEDSLVSNETTPTFELDKAELPAFQLKNTTPVSSSADSPSLSSLLQTVEQRFARPGHQRSSSVLQTKSQLRDDLAQSKQQLLHEMSKSQDLSRRLMEAEQEMCSLREQVRETQRMVRAGMQEKQRLERTVADLKKLKGVKPKKGEEPVAEEDTRRASVAASGGLRELRLGRQSSTTTRPAFAKRTSSLAVTTAFSFNAANTMPTPPRYEDDNVSLASVVSFAPTTPGTPHSDTGGHDHEALILELVQAKTAEAIAKQEAEEAKAKLEGLRKMLASKGGDAGVENQKSRVPSLSRVNSESSVGSQGTGMLHPGSAQPVTTPSPQSAAGGFWGWGKRSVSVGVTPAK